MSGVVRRWMLAVTVSVAAFALSWWVCEEPIGLGEGRATVIAAAVLAVLLAVAAWWAPLKRSAEASSALAQQSSAGRPVAGPAQPVLVPYPLVRAGNTIIVGEIPHEAVGFEPRPELLDELTASYILPAQPSSTNDILVIIGMRGTGKSQLASTIARRRLAEAWPVVAWIDAENMDQLTLGLSYLASELGLSSRDSDPYESAVRVRHWLETNAGQSLLVLDNATDTDTVRHFLPVRSSAQIIITGSNRTLASLGKSVEVGVFTPDQAIRFLANRTGELDSAEAGQVAEDLGYLPLALAQAASVILGQRLSYTAYRERLQRAEHLAEYLYRTEDDPYPMGLAPAVLLSLDTAETGGNARICREVMEFAAVLSPAGIHRMRLYTASSGYHSEIDAALHSLTDSSLLTWTGADASSVTVHRLIARVVRERAINDRTMPTIAGRISKILLSAQEKRAAIPQEFFDDLKSHSFFSWLAMMWAKVLRFMILDRSVEMLADDEIGCIFTLVNNARMPTYGKLSAVSQIRLESLQGYCDGYMFSARLDRVRAIEAAGRLTEAEKEYEVILDSQKRAGLIESINAVFIRHELARVRGKLGK